jgi:hypothetical protein
VYPEQADCLQIFAILPKMVKDRAFRGPADFGRTNVFE